MSGKRIKKITPPSLADKPGNIYGYVRVSHDDSAKSGLSIEAQIDGIQKWVAMMQATGRYTLKTWGEHGWHYEPLWDGNGHRRRDKNGQIVSTNVIRNDGIYVDMAVSAKTVPLAMRPAGGRLIQNVQAGDLIVIAKLDRAWRNTIDCLQLLKELEQRQVCVQFVDPPIDFSDYFGQFLLRQLISVAELQSDQIGAATKAALAKRTVKVAAIKAKSNCNPALCERKMSGCHIAWNWKKDSYGGEYATPIKDKVAALRLMFAWKNKGLRWSLCYKRFGELRKTYRNGRDRVPMIRWMRPTIDPLNIYNEGGQTNQSLAKTTRNSKLLWEDHVSNRKTRLATPTGKAPSQ